MVNTGRLAELYPDGGDVTPDDLVASGAVRPGRLVKVLGNGEAVGAAGQRARVLRQRPRKITAAGGTATQL